MMSATFWTVAQRKCLRRLPPKRPITSLVEGVQETATSACPHAVASECNGRSEKRKCINPILDAPQRARAGSVAELLFSSRTALG